MLAYNSAHELVPVTIEPAELKTDGFDGFVSIRGLTDPEDQHSTDVIRQADESLGDIPEVIPLIVLFFVFSVGRVRSCF